MAFPYKIRSARYCYDPKSKERFRISRSKVDLFHECRRCFYLDQRHGVARTSLPAFSLNNAVDLLLKKEFDEYRETGAWHPMLKEFGLKLKPFKHEKMDEWRDAMRHGIQYDLPNTLLTIRGGVDDIWVDADGVLYVADYKATAKASNEDVTIESEWQEMYKRQVEIYQWLLRKNGFSVSDTAYFYYVNGQTSADGFGGVLKFTVKIIPYNGSDAWVEKTLYDLNDCLNADHLPEPSPHCEHCGYVGAVLDVLHSGDDKTTEKSANKDDRRPPKTLF
jgi:hypothetical protein